MDDKQEEETGDLVRRVGTALAAVATVVVIVATAAVVFVTIAMLLRGEWLFTFAGVVATVLLTWLLSRLVRVAANQNRNPLG